MSLVSIKQDIRSLINEISKFDLSILSPKTPLAEKWGIMDDNDVQIYVYEIVDILKKINRNESVLKDLSESELTDLRGFLESVVAHYASFKEIELKDITSHHHNVLNEFKKVSQHLKTIDIYTILKIKPDVKDISSQLSSVNSLLKEFDEERFQKALHLVKELSKKKADLESRIIKEKLGTFLERAKEHKYLYRKIQINWIWLMAAIICGAGILYMVGQFWKLLEMNGDISVGAAILRISALTVPTYFLYFCINQFNDHKRYYEAYSYRNTALELMTELMTTNPDKSDFILERGLKVLFSEPLSKSEAKYDKQLMNDLISIISTQVGRKD